MTITVKYKALTTKINSKATHISRDGVGKIATGLRAAELKVRIEVEERPFSLNQNVPTCFGVQPAHIQYAPDIFHGSKTEKREINLTHSHFVRQNYTSFPVGLKAAPL